MLEADQRGIRTAVVRAAIGSDELVNGLRRRGGEVDLAIAYETRPMTGDRASLDNIDIVTFTSGSTVENFFNAIEDGFAHDALLASIGPVTTEAIRRQGRRADIEAESATVASLHAAILRACRSAATS